MYMRVHAGTYVYRASHENEIPCHIKSKLSVIEWIVCCRGQIISHIENIRKKHNIHDLEAMKENEQ